jgi:hypothetical protein
MCGPVRLLHLYPFCRKIFYVSSLSCTPSARGRGVATQMAGEAVRVRRRRRRRRRNVNVAD